MSGLALLSMCIFYFFNIQQLILELLRMYAEYSFVRHELHELSIKKLLHELHDFHTTINNQPVEVTSDSGNQTNVIIPNLIPTSATGVELNENNLEIIYLIKELKTLCHQSSWFSLTKLHLWWNFETIIETLKEK